MVLARSYLPCLSPMRSISGIVLGRRAGWWFALQCHGFRLDQSYVITGSFETDIRSLNGPIILHSSCHLHMGLRHEWNFYCEHTEPNENKARLIETMTSQAFKDAMSEWLISKNNPPILFLLDGPVQ